MSEPINKYRLFYAEAVLCDSPIPPVEKVKEIFLNLSLDEFIDMIKNMLKENDHETFQLFLYYVLIFRDMKNIQDYINSPKFDNDSLEKLIMFVYGYCMLHDYTTERILDEILYFINEERLLDILFHSKFISRDKLLLLYTLSKLSAESLNRYFQTIPNVSEFVRSFIRLPEEIMRSIIERNYRLFQYIMLQVSETDNLDIASDNLFDQYKADIKQISKLNETIAKYKKKVNLDSEKGLPFSERDADRISFLVNQVRSMKEPEKVIEYFDSENVFADEQEKLFVRSIALDPMFKNTFIHYDSMFTLD
ncbi:MAG: hypothetical protein GY754_37410 [bacterium]|nr:hypothetical protein [bacterium]